MLVVALEGLVDVDVEGCKQNLSEYWMEAVFVNFFFWADIWQIFVRKDLYKQTKKVFYNYFYHYWVIPYKSTEKNVKTFFFFWIFEQKSQKIFFFIF